MTRKKPSTKKYTKNSSISKNTHTFIYTLYIIYLSHTLSFFLSLILFFTLIFLTFYIIYKYIYTKSLICFLVFLFICIIHTKCIYAFHNNKMLKEPEKEILIFFFSNKELKACVYRVINTYTLYIRTHTRTCIKAA